MKVSAKVWVKRQWRQAQDGSMPGQYTSAPGWTVRRVHPDGSLDVVGGKGERINRLDPTLTTSCKRVLEAWISEHYIEMAANGWGFRGA